MTYVISYDLNTPGQNYNDLYKEIKAISNSWCHPVDSTWYITSDLSAEAIRNRLYAVDGTDAVIVSKASAPAAWEGLSTEVSNWLQGNL